MKRNPVNSDSLKWSCGLHGLLLTCAVIVPLLPQFRSREMPVITEFTVVLEEPGVESEPVQQIAPPPEREPVPDPPKPERLPDPKDPIAVEQQQKKDPPEPKPEPVKKQEFVKSTNRVTRVDQDFTTLKPAQKRLTPAEIKKLLDDGAKPGVKNQVPPNEVSRCISLIERELKAVWIQPGGAGAGSRPAILTIRLDANGRIVQYSIRQSSGNLSFDQTVLKAAANCPPIRGLSSGFLKQYDTIPIEFVLQ